MTPTDPPLERWAHRGWHTGAAPLENTMPAFTRALAHPRLAGIELDVQRSEDGVAVVFHDADLRRLTPGADARQIEQTPWARLAVEPLLGGAPMPSLAAVLAEVGGRVPVNVELKTEAVAAAALAAIPAGSPVVLSSFSVPALRAAARLRPDLPRALLTEGAQVDAPLALLAELGCVAWHAHRSLSRAAVEAARAAGFVVRAYTVNDAAEAARLGRWGVAAVFTDDLDAF